MIPKRVAGDLGRVLLDEPRRPHRPEPVEPVQQVIGGVVHEHRPAALLASPVDKIAAAELKVSVVVPMQTANHHRLLVRRDHLADRDPRADIGAVVRHLGASDVEPGPRAEVIAHHHLEAPEDP